MSSDHAPILTIDDLRELFIDPCLEEFLASLRLDDPDHVIPDLPLRLLHARIVDLYGRMTEQTLDELIVTVAKNCGQAPVELQRCTIAEFCERLGMDDQERQILLAPQIVRDMRTACRIAGDLVQACHQVRESCLSGGDPTTGRGANPSRIDLTVVPLLRPMDAALHRVGQDRWRKTTGDVASAFTEFNEAFREVFVSRTLEGGEVLIHDNRCHPPETWFELLAPRQRMWQSAVTSWCDSMARTVEDTHEAHRDLTTTGLKETVPDDTSQQRTKAQPSSIKPRETAHGARGGHNHDQTNASGDGAIATIPPNCQAAEREEHAVITPAGAAKSKRSTERGDGRAKLIAALTRHHGYAHGSCLNVEPIGNNVLAKKAQVSTSTASCFFNDVFNRGKSGGHRIYKTYCRDIARLIASLKLLNREFTPAHLSGDIVVADDDADQD